MIACSADPCWTAEEARDQAALAALHQLAAADAAVLRGTLPPTPPAPGLPASAAAEGVDVGGMGEEVVAEDPGEGVVEVLAPGVVTQPPAGDGVELLVSWRTVSGAGMAAIASSVRAYAHSQHVLGVGPACGLSATDVSWHITWHAHAAQRQQAVCQPSPALTPLGTPAAAC